MKIFIGADHAGFDLKNALREHLFHSQHEIEDVGALTLDNDDDYPHYAYSVASKVLGEEGSVGILVCGSGQGMAMAANRVRGIRAALAWDVASAQASKADDNSNVLTLPARFIDTKTAIAMVDAWLETEFKNNPKYKRRLDEIEELYG